jgi:hypothetical protein
MSFIATKKLKHETYNMSCSQVELKLTECTLFDAHTLYPSIAQHGGCVCGLPSMCVCHIITRDKTRMTVKLLLSLHIFSKCERNKIVNNLPHQKKLILKRHLCNPTASGYRLPQVTTSAFIYEAFLF